MDYFYHQIFRKYVIAFAHMFSNIYIKRIDENGNDVGNPVKVPIIYAGKRKLFQINKDGEDADLVKVSSILPRMGFVFSGIAYDGTRKTSSYYTIKFPDGSEMVHNGVPYNITCDLAILSKNQDDLMQIIEQIIVNFTPDKCLSIKEVDGYVTRDVPINLDSVNFGSILEYGDLEQRVVSADLSFTLKGNFYPAIDSATGTIYSVITNYKSTVGDTPTQAELISQISCCVNATNDVFSSANHGLTSGTTVYIMSSCIHPVPLEPLVPYYVINPTTNTFAIAATVGGPTIDIQSEGTGYLYFSAENFPTHDSIRFTQTISDGLIIKSVIQNY